MLSFRVSDVQALGGDNFDCKTFAKDITKHCLPAEFGEKTWSDWLQLARKTRVEQLVELGTVTAQSGLMQAKEFFSNEFEESDFLSQESISTLTG